MIYSFVLQKNYCRQVDCLRSLICSQNKVGDHGAAMTIVFMFRDDRHGFHFIAAFIFIPNKIIMSVIKIIEVHSESQVSWVDAARQVMTEVSKTIRNVKSVYIKDHSVHVENGDVKSYRINAKVSFLLD